MDSTRLHNKTCLVTGAGQNIGQAIAERFLAEGATVYLVDKNASAVEKVAEGNERAHPLAGDLTDRAFCREMIETAIREQGCLDVLVNNAYGAPYQSAVDQTDEAWDYAISLGLTAMMAACRAALPSMVSRRSGCVINLSSINAKTPAWNMAAYATIKSGIEGYTRQLAVQYGPDGVRANCLAPGFITHAQRDQQFADTPLELRRQESLIPLRRVAEAHEVASVAAFLASEEASFMSGHSLAIDGGQPVQNAIMGTWPFQEALAELGNPLTTAKKAEQ